MQKQKQTTAQRFNDYYLLKIEKENIKFDKWLELKRVNYAN